MSKKRQRLKRGRERARSDLRYWLRSYAILVDKYNNLAKQLQRAHRTIDNNEKWVPRVRMTEAFDNGEEIAINFRVSRLVLYYSDHADVVEALCGELRQGFVNFLQGDVKPPCRWCLGVGWKIPPGNACARCGWFQKTPLDITRLSETP